MCAEKSDKKNQIGIAIKLFLTEIKTALIALYPAFYRRISLIISLVEIMFVNSMSTRVRYAETDRMGVVYYGNYPQYFEIGRVEALRSLGLSYKKMEELGTILPVLKLEIKYIAPAKYDDLLEVRTEIRELPKTRITFYHEIRNEAGELLTLGTVQLVFFDRARNKPTVAPDYFLEMIQPYFES